MAPATLFLLAFLALTVWRFVFPGLWHRCSVREIEAPQQRRNSFLELRLHIFDPADVGVLAGNLENGSDGLDPSPENIARKAICAASLPSPVLRKWVVVMSWTVGTTRFEVRDRYFRRLRDLKDPKCTYEETCFYSAHKEMPKAEQIATLLLQLRNNPALFERWAHQCGPSV